MSYKLFILVSIIGLAGCMALTKGLAFPDIRVDNLRCEGIVDPLGIDMDQPRLGWKLRSQQRGQCQTAYHILVASDLGRLASDEVDLWDSGKVSSEESVRIPYAGKTLASSQRVFWKVRVWDKDGRPSAWSKSASWTMGLLSAQDWQGARWITDKDLLGQARAALGYKSEDATDVNTVKWVQIDLGEVRPIIGVRLHALRHTVPERLGFPRRFRVEAADNPEMRDCLMVFDQTGRDYPNAWTNLIEIRPTGPVSARYVRITATGLRTIQGQTCLAFSQIEVLSDGKNVAQGRKVTASDSVEQAPWAAAAAVDGLGIPGTNPYANSTLRLRRPFEVRPGLRRAVVHLCGLGHYEMSINGTRSGEGLLTPGWTAYDKTCLYDTHDVTSMLRPGANAVGLTLAGGMYNVQEGRYVKFVGPFRPLTAIGLIRLEYNDGTLDAVVTDDSWQVAAGPITFSNMFGGEDYDARLEQPGWDRPGFDTAKWRQAVAYAGPGGRLQGATHASPPFRAFEVLKATATREIRPGVTVYDLGQNASIMIRMRVRGPAGTKVKVIPAELVRNDGTVDRGSCGGGEASWNYTLAGRTDGEDWAPRFFYHGSRYLQVECKAPEGRGTAGRGIHRRPCHPLGFAASRGVRLFERPVQPHPPAGAMGTAEQPGPRHHRLPAPRASGLAGAVPPQWSGTPVRMGPDPALYQDLWRHGRRTAGQRPGARHRA